MNFDDFWCKMKLRVCLFCFCCFQHTFAESKTTKSFSEVKSVVFSLPSFQRCRQTSMCVCGTFLHELYKKVRNIEVLLRRSEILQLMSTHTKYQVHPSIINTSKPKKIKNLGIKSLTWGYQNFDPRN